MSRLRSACLALCAGALLSFLRQPLGADLLHVAAVNPYTAAAVRALALLVLALILGPLIPRAGVTSLLFFVCAGYALHGLLLQPFFWPQNTWVLCLIGVAVGAGVYLWSKKDARAESARDLGSRAEKDSPGFVPSLPEFAGLCAASAGVTIALSTLARHVRLLGLASPADDTVHGAVLLLGLWLGAIAFGRVLARPGGERALLAGGLAAAAGLCLVGYAFLRGFEEPAALGIYLRRYGLDPFYIGSLRADALFAASAFVAPAFALGTALCGLRERRQATAVLLGAAAGTLLMPLLIGHWARAVDLAAARNAPGGGRFLAIGAGCAAAGALAALLAHSQRKSAAHVAGSIAALACAAAPFVFPQRALILLSPWTRAEETPTLLVDAPEGLYTVERGPDGTLVATLDRVRLTSLAGEEQADELRVRASLAASGRPAAELRVLFVGQMTPARAALLRSLGLAGWAWSAPWSDWAWDMLSALEDGTPSETSFVRAETALEQLESSEAMGRAPEFNLVIVAPNLGTALAGLAAAKSPLAGASAPPRLAGIDHGSATAIVWMDASAPLAHAGSGSRVLLSLARVEQLSLGVLLGAGWPADAPVGAPIVLAGDSRDWGWTPCAQLSTFPKFRDARARARLCERLARAAAGTPAQELCRGLALLYGAQRDSSTWETEEQQIELGAPALARLQQAASSVRPDGFTRELWDELARVLSKKRMPDLVLQHVEPLIAAWGPWPALERALAQAYLEFDMPEEALPRLDALAARSPYDIPLLLECAAAARQAGDHEAEAGWLRRALAIQPGRPDAERLLGMALVRTGDPEGRKLVQQALLRDPDDEQLAPFLGPGPYPRVERGYDPSGNAGRH